MVTVTQSRLLLPVEALVGTGKVGHRPHRQLQHGGEVRHGDVPGRLIGSFSVSGD